MKQSKAKKAVLEVPAWYIEEDIEVENLVFALEAKLALIDVKKPRFDYQAIYQLYPWKNSKQPGIAKLRRKISSRAEYDLALKSAQKMADKAKVEGLKYIPRFMTWVNQERWLDEEPTNPQVTDVVTERIVFE